MYAASKGNVPLVALLLSKQAEINVFRPGNGASPLSVACEGGHREARIHPYQPRQTEGPPSHVVFKSQGRPLQRTCWCRLIGRRLGSRRRWLRCFFSTGRT